LGSQGSQWAGGFTFIHWECDYIEGVTYYKPGFIQKKGDKRKIGVYRRLRLRGQGSRGKSRQDWV
jgi:hypothetical protein